MSWTITVAVYEDKDWKQTGVLIINRVVSLCSKQWKLMFGLKSYDFPAKNPSHCQPHQDREECVHVHQCECTHTHICDYIKFTECKTEIYKAKPAESIISWVTTLTYHMTICRRGAVRPSEGWEYVHIFLGVREWTFVWNWNGSKFANQKQMPELPVERGRERIKRRTRGNPETKERWMAALWPNSSHT